eukprot:160649-Chlamydomonas_euryale.AAC.1
MQPFQSIKLCLNSVYINAHCGGALPVEDDALHAHHRHGAQQVCHPNKVGRAEHDANDVLDVPKAAGVVNLRGAGCQGGMRGREVWTIGGAGRDPCPSRKSIISETAETPPWSRINKTSLQQRKCTFAPQQ